MEPLADPLLNETLACGHTFHSACVQAMTDGSCENPCSDCSDSEGDELQFEKCCRMYHRYILRAGKANSLEAVLSIHMQPKDKKGFEAVLRQMEGLSERGLRKATYRMQLYGANRGDANHQNK